MGFLGRAARGVGNFGKKIWRGAGDDFTVRATSEIGDAVQSGARQAEVVRFMNAGSDELGEIAENIGKNKFVPKDISKYQDEIEKLAKDKKTGFNSDYIKNLQKERLDKWDLGSQQKIDDINSRIKSAKIEGSKDALEKELKEIEANRAKYKNSLNGKEFKEEARGIWDKEKYQELVERDKAAWKRDNPSYRIEDVDITDSKVSSQAGRESLANYSQSAKYIVDEQGNRRAYKVVDKGVAKDANGKYGMVERDVENLGDRKIVGGLKGAFNSQNRQMKRMDKAFNNNSSNTLSSNLIKMGVGTGITGAAVLAMSDNRGQQTNSQLYGQ